MLDKVARAIRNFLASVGVLAALVASGYYWEHTQGATADTFTAGAHTLSRSKK